MADSENIEPEEAAIKVMVVDDQAMVRQGLVSLLQLESGLEVVAEAGSGSEALSLLRRCSPDVILMDVRMPLMDGIECTRQVLQINPDVKVLILTTFDEDDYIFPAIEAGCCGYLLKDTLLEDLSAAIKIVHKGNLQLGPSIAPKVLARLRPYKPKEETEKSRFMTEREKKILQLIGKGQSNKEIAAVLMISEGTVKNHISSILTHLGLRDRTQAALWVAENGIN
jgi:DNA-binding NarL/FixJ family response regulator